MKEKEHVFKNGRLEELFVDFYRRFKEIAGDDRDCAAILSVTGTAATDDGAYLNQAAVIGDVGPMANAYDKLNEHGRFKALRELSAVAGMLSGWKDRHDGKAILSS